MIRPYLANDFTAVLDILRSNTPKYFHPDEEADFITYLQEEVESYSLSILEGRIVGAAGINTLAEEKEARLSWGMVHKDYHGRGVGSQLLRHRIAEITAKPSIEKIVVRTSQLVYKFYEKAGFILVTTKKDYWGDGFDLYEMHLKIH